MMKRISIFLGIVLAVLIYPINYAFAAGSVASTIFTTALVGIFPFLAPVVGLFGSSSASGPLAGLDIGGLIVGAVGTIIAWIFNVVIGFIAQILISLAGGLVNWAITLNSTIMCVNATVANPNPVSCVQSLANYGWLQTLGLANLLIVLAIVVAAFGTILRRPWGLHSLTRILIVAVLINFGYLVATWLIGVSNSITSKILDTAYLSMTWSSFTNFFTNTTAGIWSTSWGIPPAITTSPNYNAIASIVSPLFAAAFTLIAFLSLIAVAAEFFIRYVMLTILLILLPVALALSLLPIKIGNASNVWQQWLSEFIKWLTFGPIMAFFIFLAFNALNFTPSVSSGFLMSGAVSIGNYIVVIGILIAGLKIATSMGMSVAGAALGWAKKSGQWAQSKGKQWGTRVATAPLRSEGGKNFTAGLQKTNFIGTQLLGRGLNTFAAMGEKTLDEDKFKDLSPDRLGQRMLSAKEGSTDRMIGLLTLAKGDHLDKDTELNKDITDGNKALFGSFAKGKEFGDIEKAAGINTTALAALKQNDSVKADGEIDKFFEGIGPKDASKIKIDDIYNPKKSFLGLSPEKNEQYVKLVTRGLLVSPGNINKAAQNMKTKSSEYFTASIFDGAMPGLGIMKNKKIDEDAVKKIGAAQTEKLSRQHADLVAQKETDIQNLQKAGKGEDAMAKRDELAKLIAEQGKNLEKSRNKSIMETLQDELAVRRPDVHMAFSKNIKIRQTGINFTADTEEKPNDTKTP